MRDLLVRVIRALKRDKSYTLDSNYAVVDLLSILWWRGWQMLRGVSHAWRVGTVRLPLFMGRRVVLEHAGLLRCGRSCILEDGVFVNALSKHGVRLGDNVTVGKGAIIQCTGVIARRGIGLEIGANSAVGAQSFIGAQGGIRIGANVIMGPGVRIFSENHEYSNLMIPIRLQGESRRGVVIEDDCWVGSGVTILDGVSLGTGCIVGAGAVVTRVVRPRTIVAGVPAREIAMRDGSTKAEA